MLEYTLPYDINYDLMEMTTIVEPLVNRSYWTEVPNWSIGYAK